MNLKFRESIAADKDFIVSLLQTTKLPTESLAQDVTAFYVTENEDGPTGIAGFEFYGDDALLRSVAVLPQMQRHGLGLRIVEFMLDEARRKNIRNVVLLTETARDFFLKKDFKVVDRSSVQNEAMKESSEFSFACPKSAVCMILKLR